MVLKRKKACEEGTFLCIACERAIDDCSPTAASLSAFISCYSSDMESHAQNISPEWSSSVALGLHGSSSASVQLSNLMHAMPFCESSPLPRRYQIATRRCVRQIPLD